jgi:D-cysteine desulfhydrase
MKLPARIALANLPTKIEKLERLSTRLGGPDLYIKRDDQTGMELSGNKIRKLEFAIQEALDQGCDTLVTCGGLQSNHARATAAAAARLGLGCCLLLAADEIPAPQGNLLMDRLFGAQIRTVSFEDFAQNREAVMAAMLTELAAAGKKGYLIPLGASNGIGTFGYYRCLEEIAAQEEALGFRFDRIVMAVGSGATYAGLFYANRVLGRTTAITGVNISADAAFFQTTIRRILQESFEYTGEPVACTPADIDMLDGYVGLGYALNQPEELRFIAELAALEGIVLDPVYTGKAMLGLAEEIKKGRFDKQERILFIHTGGLYGAFSKFSEFQAAGI